MFDGQWSEGALECVRVDGKTVSPRKLELSFLLHLIKFVVQYRYLLLSQSLSMLMRCGVTLTVIVDGYYYAF